MTTYPTIASVVLDTRDARGLAEFYRQLLGLVHRAGDEPPSDGSADDADWLVLTRPDGTRQLAFQEEPEHVASTWPDHRVPQQLHIDYLVEDVAALERHKDVALRLGAVDRIRFLGECDEDGEGPVPGVPALLSALDVFVSTSREESFGLAAVEALAAGLPVLHDACPAIDDLPAAHAPEATRIAGEPGP